MSSWTELSLWSQGCEPPSPEQLWHVSSQKHLTPRQAHDCPAHLLLAPPAQLSQPVTQMLPPGSGHQLEKAQRLGGGCLESLIHPDWHNCGASARGLCHLQTGDRTAGAVGK